MAESNRLKLRQQLVDDYDGLVKNLARRLGRPTSRTKRLHETFVRLGNVADAAEIRQPADYIFRTAINVAKNTRKAQSYRVSASEIDELIGVSDEAPTPAQVVEIPLGF